MAQNKTAKEIEDDLSRYKQELSDLVQASKDRFEKEVALLQNQMTEITTITRKTAELNAKRKVLQNLLKEFVLTQEAVLKVSIQLCDEGVVYYNMVLAALGYAKVTDLYDNDEPKRLESIAKYENLLETFSNTLKELKISGKSKIEKQTQAMERIIKVQQEQFVN